VLGVQQLAERGVTIRTLLRTHPGKQWEVARGFRFRIWNASAASALRSPRCPACRHSVAG
jgi:hypothetical protein